MVRLLDVPEPTRTRLEGLDCPTFDTEPWVEGPPLNRRTVALVSSAGLSQPGQEPFGIGATDLRVLDDGRPEGWLMSHVSVNYDRTGFQRDVNVVFPLDRLEEMRRDGEIGAIAPRHYSVMGATDPREMAGSRDAIAAGLRRDGADAVVLLPV